jgi:hypothetical protein
LLLGLVRFGLSGKEVEEATLKTEKPAFDSGDLEGNK